jgi:Kef-type K+ transport system membrane component KefB/nucleotide-binding universal stress UspA family protein
MFAAADLAHAEYDLMVFWVQLLALVVGARTLGWVMVQLGLPRVIGELGAGVMLGPSLFGHFWPEQFAWFLPAGGEQAAALLTVSWIGVALLLVLAGFETDLGLIAKLGRPAVLVAVGSMLVPAGAGSLVGWLIPGEFLGPEATRSTFLLFVALAVSVSALAVVAKILSDLGLMRRDFGQITVAVGMANDVVGWVLLGILTSVVAAGGVSATDILISVGGLLLFMVLALTVGQWLVDRWLRRTRRGSDTLGAAVTVAVVTMLGFGVVTQGLGVEAVVGAFVAGVVLHRSRFVDERLEHSLERLTSSFFAPVFFATAGLQVNLLLLEDPTILTWTVVIVAVAIAAKFAGAYGGARVAGRSHRAGMALGAGLNARGTLEIVIASVGLSLGVFNTASFTIIVLVPLVTSIFASVALRLVVFNWRGDAAEIRRLEREQALSENLVVRTSRLLIPSRGGPASIAAAQLMHYSWPPEAEVTVFTAAERRASFDFEPLENALHGRDLDFERVRERDVAELIAKEAALGYGAIGMGVQSSEEIGQVISPLVDEVLRVSPIPVVVVRRARNLDRPLPGAYAKALVPASGGPASRAAAEVAGHLSSQLGTQIVLAHIVGSAEGMGGLRRLPTMVSAGSWPGIWHDDEEIAEALDVLSADGPPATATGPEDPAGAESGEDGGWVESEQPGTPPGRGPALAGSLGATMARLLQAPLDLLRPRRLAMLRSPARATGIGEQVLSQASQLVERLGVEPQLVSRPGTSVAIELLDLVNDTQADLVVMGANLRRLRDRPFLGHTVETVLRRCDATVALVLVPFDL